jgi:enoyl-CoA hydratase
MSVLIERQGAVTTVVIDRPRARNAIDRATAEALAAQIAAFPQTCLRRDRLSSYEQWGLPLAEALKNECRHGRISLASGDAQSGAGRFREGEGRHGNFR